MKNTDNPTVTINGVKIDLLALCEKGNFTVRYNLLFEKDYTGYCGNNISRFEPGGCSNRRTKWDGAQFTCPECGWRSEFPDEFIQVYKHLWNK